MEKEEFDRLAHENMKKLIECGWLEKNIDKYTEEKSNNFGVLSTMIFFIVLSIFLGGTLYYISHDKFKSENNLACPSVNIPDCPSFPSIPSCPTCSLSCGNTTINVPNKLNLNVTAS